MGTDASELITAAREFCALIESTGCESDAWLDKLATVLPRLHLAVSTQPAVGDPDEAPLEADLDKRFELYSRLKARLGELDAYWLEFDVATDGQEMSGSLADDLTDIYCELREGLRHLARGEDTFAVLRTLQRSFRLHWGQHLLDAERHLYGLRARAGLSRAAMA